MNKLNTKVILRWNIDSTSSLPESVRERFYSRYRRRITKSGELIVTSTRFRDQGRNVADAINKLKELVLSVAEEPRPRKKKKRSPGANRRRLANKKIQSDKKKSRRSPRFDRGSE